ncbi:MAG: hypothetical protein JWQ03_3250 [Variovorax sp.]|nr:hypothetical protein [Variovorax sp.]
MSALSALLFSLLSFLFPGMGGTDAGMIMTPADYCSPIVWDEGPTMEHSPAYLYTADEAEWQALLDMGWQGMPDDSMEALYPADCLMA